jgi:hypothetical protein
MHPIEWRAHQPEDASRKHPKIVRKNTSANTINVIQPTVDGHLVDTTEHPRVDPQVCTIKVVGRSEDPDSLVLGNHNEFHGVQEFFMNYSSSGELFDCKTTIVNSCFSITIGENLLNDHNPKSMAQCQQCSD